MNSIVLNGKVLDFHFQKLSKNIYNFSIGNIFIGQIFKHSKHNWHAVSFYNVKGSMGGFGNRYYACEYLLKINKLER